jgi:hypothetical protein
MSSAGMPMHSHLFKHVPRGPTSGSNAQDKAIMAHASLLDPAVMQRLELKVSSAPQFS